MTNLTNIVDKVKGSIDLDSIDEEQTKLQLRGTLLETATSTHIQKPIDTMYGKNWDWDIRITDNRVAVWSPQSYGFGGNPRIKTGISTGGIINFSNIVFFFVIYLEDKYFISIQTDFSNDPDFTSTEIVLIFSEADTKSFLDAFFAHFTEYWKENVMEGMKEASLTTLEKYIETVKTGYPKIEPLTLRILKKIAVIVYNSDPTSGEVSTVNEQITEVNAYEDAGIHLDIS